MSHMGRHAAGTTRDQLVFAVVLIAIGILGLVSRIWQPTADMGGWIVALIGLGFLGAFAYTRHYGYLVPGSIMTGLGLGILASEAIAFATDEGTGGAVVLGLGAGFLGIWAIGTLVHLEQHHWWPLIPGGILATVGTALLVGGGAIRALDYWGVILVAIGVIVIIRAWRRGQPRT